ncbi:1157_t:CDS:2 [Funneliformis geosporum]|uniref:1157_t:CDS:1 n=1 Tax=Funneliformis geosporum TaxID=1117311 RepID=A0A9W4WU60_9GLOM|nr:1157_t:CDS:2 [Funneliformis geosporum]
MPSKRRFKKSQEKKINRVRNLRAKLKGKKNKNKKLTELYSEIQKNENLTVEMVQERNLVEEFKKMRINSFVGALLDFKEKGYAGAIAS